MTTTQTLTKQMTLEDLKAMEPHTIFDEGLCVVLDKYQEKEITTKWIARRGEIHDWKIYLADDQRLQSYENSEDYPPSKDIASHGRKLHDEKLVRQLVPCEDEAFEMYRH